ncbi:MAG: hypothetical protein SVY10_16955 [Thermodesulfobacteriota bacterium]|nr:hypothetical protein [Thermodesulfobacteriota bacterium]
MHVKERLIKEIQKLTPEDIMNVYELVLELNKQKPSRSTRAIPAYFQVQEILKKCPGSLSDDINSEREDRI